MSKHNNSDKWFKWFLVFVFIYFLVHTVYAFSAETIVINQPDGGQKVCIVSGSYVTCY